MNAGNLSALHPPTTNYTQIGQATVPWSFSDYATEYHAIRGSVALLDHSALGLTRLSGKDTQPLLQRVLARDIDYLEPERAMMALILEETGAPIDLVTVYSFDDHVLLESSWGCAEATRSHLQRQATGEVEVTAVGDQAIIGLEGPLAWGVVGRVLDPSISALPYEGVVELDSDSATLIFSRTGLTGEYGYKLIGPADVLAGLWSQFAEEATPAGQQALETAMIEVRQPLLHREISAGRNVVTCGAQWLADPSKSDFLGRDSLLEMLADTSAPRTVALTWDGDAASPGAEVSAAGTAIGTIAVQVHSPGLGQQLGLATVSPELAAAGLPLSVVADGEAVGAVSIAPPYVVPKSWSTPIL